MRPFLAADDYGNTFLVLGFVAHYASSKAIVCYPDGRLGAEQVDQIHAEEKAGDWPAGWPPQVES